MNPVNWSVAPWVTAQSSHWLASGEVCAEVKRNQILSVGHMHISLLGNLDSGETWDVPSKYDFPLYY